MSPAARKRTAGDRAGARAVGFFRDCLVHVKGEWAGRPFKLLPWQEAIIRALFGTLRPDGLRQYRRCYLEIPRKNGKSALAAGIALYLLLGEDEPGAEIYSAAVDREQAAIVFRSAREMVEASPVLMEHVELYRNVILRPATGGTYRVLSADVATKHGLNAHGIIFDELHAQPDRELWDVLTTATGARRQPLTVAITTAGYDRHTICWDQHEYAERVLNGVFTDAEFYGLLYAASREDDWTSPATWAKANPSLDRTISSEYLASECLRAQRSPAYLNSFLRYHLNVWTEQISRWMPMEAWRACGGVEVADEDLVGLPAFGGLDLGVTEDFSAFVIVFLLADGRVALRARYWLPSAAVLAHPERPYAVWERTGALQVSEGNATDLDAVEADVFAWCRRFGVAEVAYDAKHATGLALHLQNQGLTMIDQPQGVQLNEPLRKILELVHAGKLVHGDEAILTWMASNMVVRTNYKGEMRPDKDSAGDKIDGMVALAMAIGRAIRHQTGTEESAYADGHGLVTV